MAKVKKTQKQEARVFVHEVIALAQANIVQPEVTAELDPTTNPPVNTEPTTVLPEANPAETPAPNTEPEPFIPSPTNAPEGMVFCRVCKKHVPKKDTFPTTEYGVAMCKKPCENQTSIQAAAKLASANVKVKAAKAPKTGTPRISAYAPENVILVKVANPKKNGTYSHTAFAQYQTGMTVAEYVKIIAGMDTGHIEGVPEIRHDLGKGFITLLTPAEYDEHVKAITEPSA